MLRNRMRVRVRRGIETGGRLILRHRCAGYASIASNGVSEKIICMKVQSNGETLSVTGIKELGAANSNTFRDQVKAEFREPQKNIEIDLSQTNFVDSCGLGALISLHKATCNRNGTVRLVNPTAPVQQILELTRMHRIFEIVNQPE
jgi:anti-sigma B factor antagonist